jgi:hypothetical protein
MTPGKTHRRCDHRGRAGYPPEAAGLRGRLAGRSDPADGDTRLVGPDGVVNATLAKLKGAPLAQPAAITRVPRTEGERQQLLLVRPVAWEYLYLAGQLLHERNNPESKYRDHKLQYARSTGEIVKGEDVPSFISVLVNDAQRLSGNISMLVNDKAAFARAVGAPGQPGDPNMIAHLAMRWNSAYEEFLDWAARMRGASIATEYRHLLELLARYSDGPVEQYREFVDKLVERADGIPAAIAASESGFLIELQLKISIPDEVSAAYNAEFDRLKPRLQRESAKSR